MMENGESKPHKDFVLNALADVTTKVNTLADLQIQTNSTLAVLAGHVQSIAGHVQTLAGQVEHIARQQLHINEVVAVIAESQQHTDERLNALIDIVRNGRNGQSKA